MQVIKRDGRKVEFDSSKIESAIKKATHKTGEDINEEFILSILDFIKNQNKDFTVEQIQDIIVKKLMCSRYKKTAEEYIKYREKRTSERNKNNVVHKTLQTIHNMSELANLNANQDDESFSGIASSTCENALKEEALNYYVPELSKKFHNENKIYIHDLGSYAQGSHNCIFIDFSKKFKTGTNTGHGSMDKPERLRTAFAQVAVVFQAQQNEEFGGMGANKIDYDLAPFVDSTFKKYLSKYIKRKKLKDIDLKYDTDKIFIPDEYLEIFEYAKEDTEEEAFSSAVALIHNLNTMNSRSAGQVPFTSINYGTDTSPQGRLITKSLMLATMKGMGEEGTTPIFPIQIWKYKEGISDNNPNSPNYDLFLMAVKCASMRIYPNFVNLDSIQAKSIYVEGNPDTELATFGCRTMQGIDRFGWIGLGGRGNISPCSVNYVNPAIKNGICLGERNTPNIKGFEDDLFEAIDVAIFTLLERFKWQGKQKAKRAKFMYGEGIWKNGETLDFEDEVGELLKHGSLAVGMIGLAESMKALFGKTHAEDKYVYEYALNLMKKVKQKIVETSEKYNMNFSLYYTPAESYCMTSVKKDREIYGNIDGVTNREYYTNSTHVPVYHNCTIKEKLDMEVEFSKLSTGGCIAYVELDGNMRENNQAMIDIIEYAMKIGTPYFALNHSIDECKICGYEGIINDECPKCNSKGEVNFKRLRRVTGYLTGDFRKRFNKGKQAEVLDRVKHGKNN